MALPNVNLDIKRSSYLYVLNLYWKVIAPFNLLQQAEHHIYVPMSLVPSS